MAYRPQEQEMIAEVQKMRRLRVVEAEA